MLSERIRLKLRNIYIKYTIDLRKKKINNNDFTIIANNCWGGVVYESYGLKKMTPTIGMYMAPEDYIQFVSNLKHYILEEEITFIPPESAKHKDLFARSEIFGSFPIAKLGDLEMAFAHYKSEQETKEKWERRCSRVNWDKLIVKMNDQNGCTYEQMQEFMAANIDCKQKLFFTAHKDWARNNKGVIYVPQFFKEYVFASTEPFGKSWIFDVNKMINNL